MSSTICACQQNLQILFFFLFEFILGYFSNNFTDTKKGCNFQTVKLLALKHKLCFEWWPHVKLISCRIRIDDVTCLFHLWLITEREKKRTKNYSSKSALICNTKRLCGRLTILCTSSPQTSTKNLLNIHHCIKIRACWCWM